MYILPKGTELTSELLMKFIAQHRKDNKRRKELREMYEGDHKIKRKSNKLKYKPDKRLVVPYAKYIVDTFNGFFIGIPVKVSHDDKDVDEYLQFLDAYNNLDDHNAELSKLSSMQGEGFELEFMDEEAEVGITYISAEEAFVIQDDSIRHQIMYGVRYYQDTEGVIVGTVSDSQYIWEFSAKDNYKLSEKDRRIHPFGAVPLHPLVENEEKMSIFEAVTSLMNEVDEAISEKANDVDYFADAYLKILGVKIDEKDLKEIRNNRIINLVGKNGKDVEIGFLEKPDADNTQEHLLDRLDTLIFHLSMVANINDDTFGDTTGIALKYKLLSMDNLANVKERKLVKCMQYRYKLISNLPNSKIPQDAWLGIQYQFTRNIPSNELEESEIARNLDGIVSRETQLKGLSCVDNVNDELARIEDENAKKIASIYDEDPDEPVEEPTEE